jgi:hypothetical protein
MGIDVYLKWKNMNQDEKKQQITGFSITAGGQGYLREAYHGGPYATRILCREAFESETSEAPIPAAVLRERLTNVTEPARGVEGGDLAAMLITALFGSMTDENGNLPDGAHVQGGHTGDPTTEPMTVEEAVILRNERLYGGDGAEEALQSFRDFVALAERKERETGEPCTIYASY